MTDHIKLHDDLAACRAELARETERAEKAENAYHVRRCPDCDGEGHLGRAPNGKYESCELCGGHEDALGRGFLYYDDPGALSRMTAERDAATARVAELERRLAAMTERAEKAEREANHYQTDLHVHVGFLLDAEAQRDRLTGLLREMRDHVGKPSMCDHWQHQIDAALASIPTPTAPTNGAGDKP